MKGGREVVRGSNIDLDLHKYAVIVKYEVGDKRVLLGWSEQPSSGGWVIADRGHDIGMSANTVFACTGSSVSPLPVHWMWEVVTLTVYTNYGNLLSSSPIFPLSPPPLLLCAHKQTMTVFKTNDLKVRLRKYIQLP